MSADQLPHAEGLPRAVPAGGAANPSAEAAPSAALPAPSDAEGDRHDPRHQLGNLTEDSGDRELLARLGDVLDRVDPMPPGLVAAGRAVFTAPLTASTGVPRAPVEAPEPAGGATAPIPAAPPAHQLRLTPWQRFLQRLLDLIGRPA